MAKVYLTGIETGEGMFSDEFVVRYRCSDGRRVNGFFDKEFVTKKGLEVTLRYYDRNLAAVLTPNNGFFETGPCITVPLEDLFCEEIR